MMSSFVEKQIESAVHDAIGEKAMRIVDGISKIAAKQGGQTAAENYQLLGKRALIALGVTIVTVQLTASVIGLVVSRKREEKRIEETVRRVLAEERQREEASSQAPANQEG